MKEPEELIIYCDTSQKATELFEIFKCKGYIWADYRSIDIERTNWEDYKTDTVYHLKKGKIKYGYTDYYDSDITKITANQYILRYGNSRFTSVYNFFKGIILSFDEGGMSDYVKESLFDTTDHKEILQLLDETELEEKYEEYTEKYFLIPGDVIEISGGKTKGIVLKHEQSGYKILWRNMKSSGLMTDDEFERIGHIDITEILNVLND